MPQTPHEFDKSNLRQIILGAPKQFAEGFNLAKEIRIDGDFDRAIFYGEGGSAFPASLVNTLVKDAADKAGVDAPRICQNHTYSLKPEASKDALNIFCSYSGNTEETITTLNKAIEAGLPSVVVSSGGKLEEIAKDKGLSHVKLPMPTSDFQPRMGTGYFVGAMLQVLANANLAVDFSAEILESAKGYDVKMEDFEKKGVELAQKIVGKTPLVWANQMYKEVARVWTIKFNEHAKNPAFFNFF